MKTIDQIRLKPATMSLLSQKWVDWLNDPEVVRFSNQKNQTHSLQSQSKFLAEKLDDPNAELFGVFLQDSHIGMIEIANMDPVRKSAEVRYMIGEKALWGLGIASYIIGEVVKKYRKNKNIEILEAGAEIQNIGSIKALEKNGFTFSGQQNNIRWFSKKI